MTAIIAIVIQLVPYIPVFLQLAGWLMNLFGASKENLAAYQAMIEKNAESGLITVETYQRLSDFHQQMLAKYNASAGGVVPPDPTKKND